MEDSGAWASENYNAASKASNEKMPETEIEIGGVNYVRKSKYMTLQRRIFLLESYLNSTKEQIESIRILLKELRDEDINRK